MAPLVRNFATTVPLLCSTWAQTSQELVSEIRLQASLWIKPGLKWQITDPNGTHMEGVILSSPVPDMKYGTRREEGGSWLPWPEWVVPPIAVGETSGIVVFDRMLSSLNLQQNRNDLLRRTPLSSHSPALLVPVSLSYHLAQYSSLRSSVMLY